MKDQNQTPKRKISPKFTVPFFVVMAVLTLASFSLTLRPTVSNSEKRELAKFPDFTWESLVSGDYFDGISTWFSDTFPGRETWLNVASDMKSLYGSSEVMIEGDLPALETVPPIPDAPAAVDSPETHSPVQTEPETTEAAEAAEATGETQPERWGGVDAGDNAEILMASAVIQIGDSAFNAQGFSQIYSDDYIKTVNSFAKSMAEKDITVVSAPSPTAVGIMIEEEYLAKLNCASQDQMLRYLHAGMSDDVVKVDTVGALLPHNDEYIYFRTDHHWTALGAYYSYEAICKALGMEPVDLDSLETWDQGEFQGSLYGKVKNPRKLKLDTVTAYIPIGDITNTVYNQDGYGIERDLLTDTTQREHNTRYLVFGTDYPLTHTHNASLPDAPNVLLVKDSFGNCIVPFMTQNFRNVYAVDYRKYWTMPLNMFVDKYDIDYVIFMPYLTATQSSQGVDLLYNVCF